MKVKRSSLLIELRDKGGRLFLKMMICIISWSPSADDVEKFLDGLLRQYFL